MNANSTAAEGDTGGYILDARLRSVFDRLTATSVVTVVNAALMASALEQSRFTRGPLIWIALVCALAAARVASDYAYKKDAGKAARVRLWAWVSIVGARCAGHAPQGRPHAR